MITLQCGGNRLANLKTNIDISIVKHSHDKNTYVRNYMHVCECRKKNNGKL